LATPFKPFAPLSLARRAAAEAVGTALLLATVVGSGIMGERLSGGNAAIALAANSLATGAGLTALILSFASISGAHFNPVVTLADAAMLRRPWSDVPAYVAAQFLGAFAGVALAHGMFGEAIFSAARLPPLTVMPVEAGQQSPHLLLRDRTLLVLLTPAVTGQAPRLVHRQRRIHEQYQQAGTGGDHELDPRPAQISTGQRLLCRRTRQEANWLRVNQQNEGGKSGYQEFHQDPIVPEQAPLGTQRLDEPGE
jgi:Major intrinsic protein